MRLTTFFRKLLHKTSAKVTSVRFVEDAERPSVEVEVQPPWRSPRCGVCGRPADGLHGQTPVERSWKHLGLLGLRLSLHCPVYRVRCNTCGVKTMLVPWARTGSLFTRSFEDEMTWFLQHADQTTTSTYFGVSWMTVGRVATRVAEEKRDPQLPKDLTVIGVDEIFYGRPRKALTVVVNPLTGRVIWSGKGESAATLKGFFAQLGTEGRRSIQVVSMDMDAAFEKAVRESLPHAKIVYDRFHVVQLVNEAVDETRRAEVRQAPDKAEAKALKGVRFATLKSPWNLTRRDKERLSELSKKNRRLYRAYLLKEAFLEVFETTDPEEADKIFKEWYGWARRSRLEHIRRLAQSLRDRWAGIRRYVELKVTNGIVEGFNAKIRMLSHRAFGFHSAEALIAMIYLCCSGIRIRPIGYGGSLPKPLQLC